MMTGAIFCSVWILRGLKSDNVDLMLKTLVTLRSTLPPAECLKAAVMLLNHERLDIRAATCKCMCTF